MFYSIFIKVMIIKLSIFIFRN